MYMASRCPLPSPAVPDLGRLVGSQCPRVWGLRRPLRPVYAWLGLGLAQWASAAPAIRAGAEGSLATAVEVGHRCLGPTLGGGAVPSASSPSPTAQAQTYAYQCAAQTHAYQCAGASGIARINTAKWRLTLPIEQPPPFFCMCPKSAGIPLTLIL